MRLPAPLGVSCSSWVPYDAAPHYKAVEGPHISLILLKDWDACAAFAQSNIDWDVSQPLQLVLFAFSMTGAGAWLVKSLVHLWCWGQSQSLVRPPLDAWFTNSGLRSQMNNWWSRLVWEKAYLSKSFILGVQLNVCMTHPEPPLGLQQEQESTWENLKAGENATPTLMPRHGMLIFLHAQVLTCKRHREITGEKSEFMCSLGEFKQFNLIQRFVPKKLFHLARQNALFCIYT